MRASLASNGRISSRIQDVDFITAMSALMALTSRSHLPKLAPNSLNNRILIALACATLLTLAACTRAPQQAMAQLPPFKPSASIQDLMTAIVDPSADALWEAVGSETTSRGIEENSRAPSRNGWPCGAMRLRSVVQPSDLPRLHHRRARHLEPATVNFAGRQLHGAPKTIVNTGVDYARPLGRYLGRVFVNNAYRSGTHLASNQSALTYRRAYSLTDGGISFGTPDGKYELSLVGKNLFDKQYATGAGSFGSSGAVTSQPGYDRTFAAVFRAKL